MWSKYYLFLRGCRYGPVDFHRCANDLVPAKRCVSHTDRGAWLFPAARGREDPGGIKEAPVFCVVPLCVSTGCIALFFFVDDLYNLLLPLVGDMK